MITKKDSNWINKGGDLSLHVPTGMYYVRKSFLRLKIPNLFKNTGETILWKAKAKSPEIIKNHLDVHLKKVKTVGEVIDEFLKIETPIKRRERTQENHRLYFAELKKELGNESIVLIDNVYWLGWLDSFRKRKSRTTFNDYAIYMNMLLRYAYGRRYVPFLSKLSFTDKKRHVGRVLSKEEIERLYNAMSETTKDQYVLAYECCMRLREALNLTWDRVNLDNGTITLRQEDVKTGSRTGRGREFIITDNALKRLRNRFLKRDQRSPFVFPSKSNLNKPQRDNKKAWILAKKRAGIKGRCRWHDLRHTALTHMLLVAKQPPVLVSEYAGVSIRTIQSVYLHSTAEQTKSVAVLKIGSK